MSDVDGVGRGIAQVIRFAVVGRKAVLGLAGVLVAGGIWAWSTIPFEPFPDLTANSVSVIADAPGMAPQEVEQLVTFPIERSLLGLPRTQTVRSTTKFGVSITQVVFDDRVDPYFARQVVNERLNNVVSDLPTGVTVSLGPVSTAMGEVFQYVLTTSNQTWDTRSLKTLHDYTIAPQLRTVTGVAEVNSWGGFVEQYHITLDPRRLAAAGLTLADIENAIAKNNRNFGGTYTESRGERYVIRGMGRLENLDDLRAVQVASVEGAPLRLGDVSDIQPGALPRQGAVTYNGAGEVVSGMVIMRKGENAQRVIEGIRERVADIEASLPAGVSLVPYYEQAHLVDQTTHTIKKNLFLGGTLVVLLLWVFLRNVAASIVVALVIPLSMMWAFIAMRLFGFSANLMSLGALDFGLLVDASVVMVENVMRRAGDTGDRTRRIVDAAVEVGRPVVFGIVIIIAVYVPVFALQGTEGKMFIPMAFTVIAALIGSLLLAMTLVPALARIFLANAREVHTPLLERVKLAYRRLLETTLERPATTLSVAFALVVLALGSGTRLGTEFMPRLDEGSVLVQTVRLPSTGLEEGVGFSTSLERALLTVPEVTTVVSKLGRPDLATEAMGTYESDTYVMLMDRADWRPGGKDALLSAMDEALQDVPGISYAFTQPIQMRLDEAESGITTDVGVKIYGDDAQRLAAAAARAEAVVGGIPGAADVKVTAASMVKELRVALDRDAMTRLGLSSEDVGHQVELALGSAVVTEVVDGPRRIDVAIRMPHANGLDPATFGMLPISVAQGVVVPLSRVARVEVVEVPEAFAHEGANRLVVVGANIRGRDVGGFVRDASAALAQDAPLPEGYRYEWGGQYRHQQTAVRRLAILVPLSIGAIYLLLYLTFGSFMQGALIMTNVPFALAGGVAALWLSGLNFSTSAIIGFIAVFGIAVLNGVVMVTYINELRRDGASLHEAVVTGAVTRLRPVLMTAAAATLGFIPMAISHSPGAELQRPLATVVIGGLVTATVLTLVVLPTTYRLMEAWLARRRESA
ncbi:MAG: CusA/CzcA family heavy metal efflux RND transporter [Longimicrobiales bacterium]